MESILHCGQYLLWLPFNLQISQTTASQLNQNGAASWCLILRSQHFSLFLPPIELTRPSWKRASDIASSITSSHTLVAALILSFAVLSPMSSFYSLFLCALSLACYIKKNENLKIWYRQPRLHCFSYLFMCWSSPGTMRQDANLCSIALPWLNSRSCFLSLLFFSLSFSWVLIFGHRFCFLLPKSSIGLQQ